MVWHACRESWKALAAGQGSPGSGGMAEGQHLHLQFCNMIINDSTYLLGEALEKLPQVVTHQHLSTTHVTCSNASFICSHLGTS